MFWHLPSVHQHDLVSVHWPAWHLCMAWLFISMYNIFLSMAWPFDNCTLWFWTSLSSLCSLELFCDRHCCLCGALMEGWVGFRTVQTPDILVAYTLDIPLNNRDLITQDATFSGTIYRVNLHSLGVLRVCAYAYAHGYH